MNLIKPLMIMLSVSMLLPSATIVKSNQIEEDDIVTYQIDEPYQYPIVPGTEEWQELDSLQKKIDVCHIPDNIISKMTTEALVQSVLDYPLLLNMAYFNTFEVGYNNVKSYFTAIGHLESRGDAAEALLKEYEKLPVITNESYSVDIHVKYTCLETILGQPVIYDTLSDKQIDELQTLINIKYGIDVLNQKFAITEGESVANPDFYRVRQEHTSNSVLSVTYSTVYTPKGTPVNVFSYSSDSEVTTDERISQMVWEDETYPNNVRLRHPTRMYNCHSYAWYSQSSSNPYWMNYPTGYMSDGSYTEITSSSPIVNAKVYYPQSQHSGIVYTAGSTWASSRIKSKWGEGSLIIHDRDDSPYSYSGARYYK